MTTIIDPTNNRTIYKTAQSYDNARKRFQFTQLGVARFRDYDLKRDGLISINSTSIVQSIEQVLYEKGNVDYLIGVELEIEGCNGRDDSERTATVARALRKYLPANHICVPDGSITDGLEIVTAPLTPTEISRIGWYGLLRELSRAGCKSHESGRCGLHISISRKYLTDSNWIGLRSFIVKHKAFFKSISRRDGNDYYCKYITETTKYSALNLSKLEVCEFRFFRGTLKPSSFVASLELVRALVEYARSLQDKDRKRLTVSGFIKTLERPRFSVARAYVGERLALLNTTTHLKSDRATRARFSNEQRAHNAIHALVGYRNDYNASIEVRYVANGNQLVADVHSRNTFSDTLSISHSDTATEYDYPIDWGRSRLPRALRVAASNGWLGNTIRISSKDHTWADRSCVVLYHSRGGWGNPSRISLRIVRPIN